MLPKSQLCGLRPTGDLHIGHYFAVIRPALAGAEVLIATYHAPEATSETVDKVIATLERFGVPRRQIKRQERVFSAEVYFRMLHLTHLGELERMTQYREASEKNPHLFVYPVLMAHDVVNYDEVIVGDDQTQHLNFARDLIKRYNKAYDATFHVPIARPTAGRVMSLTDPAKKMSKSEPNGCIFLNDLPQLIIHKVRKAVADEAGRENLIELYRQFGGVDPIPQMNAALKNSLTARILNVLETTERRTGISP